MKRSASLAEVACWTRDDGGRFGYHIWDFLDPIYLARRADVLPFASVRRSGATSVARVSKAALPGATRRMRVNACRESVQ